MADFISKEEVLKIAEISKLKIEDKNIDKSLSQLNDILTYSLRVEEIAKQVTIPSHKSINSDRSDTVIRTDSKEILEGAPKIEDDYFVVPRILEK